MADGVTISISKCLIESGLGDVLCQVDTDAVESVRLKFENQNDAGVYHVCEIRVINKPGDVVRCGK